MNKNMDKNEDLSQKIGNELGRDLQQLFGSPSPIPGDLDVSVMEQYRRSRTHRIRLRWLRYAAAAMVLLTVGLFVVQDRSPSDQPGPVAAGPMDIDRDGSVNILDALRLAQQLPNAQELLAQWDFNGDGTIDRRDVDIVAYRAVRLSAQEVM